ncbi:FUSC family protein [Patulibacter sp. NPDC049589]|uniref:FUSC family protein n=1 Tax=Patulibacter sp. NPDC049589 TaxID=3154731 RepID=UPI00341B4FBA
MSAPSLPTVRPATAPEAAAVPPGPGPARRARGSWARAWRDLVVASDPGLGRLTSAVQLMLALTVTIAVVHVFMQTTHVLWVDTPTGAAATPEALAAAAAQHHGITLLATLLGGLIAMMSVFAVMDRAPREQAVTMVLMPVPMLATMALSVEMVPHRTAGIALLAIVIGVGTYARKFIPRFGPRAFLYGAMLFIGYIFGFLSNGGVAEGQIGGIAIVLWLAVAINFVLKVAVDGPLDRGRLGRIARAFRARCRGVASAAAALLAADSPRERERASRLLDRRLTRLNETALVIDGSIASPNGRDLGAAAFDAHDELFRLELVVQNLGRAVQRFGACGPLPEHRAEVRSWLDDLAAGDHERASAAAAAFLEREAGHPSPLLEAVPDEIADRLHHLARLVTAASRALETWPRHHAPTSAAAGGAPFESAVTLIFGDLPGSALVGAQAAAPPEGRRSVARRLRLDPPAQLAIRVTLAVGAAAAVGSILSERRFYWAVIAVFIAFMGANTSGEQITKGINRVMGTVLGILVGSVLAHLVGHSGWAVVVIVVALGFGIYVMKVSYALWVVGITVAVSQLYEQLGEYSNHLLVLRLEETAIGAVIAAVAALVIFPVNTRRAATFAARGHLDALADLLDGLGERASAAEGTGRAPGADGMRLTSAARALDHAANQLFATTRPLRLTPFRRDRLEHNAALFAQTAHQARNLVSALDAGAASDPRVADEVRRATETLAATVRTLSVGLGGAEPVGRPRRLDGERIAGLDRALAAEGVPSDDLPRVLLRRIDRFDETVAELTDNLTSRRAGRSGVPAVVPAT